MLTSRLSARLRDDEVPEVELERRAEASCASETDKERERDRVSDAAVWDRTEEERWMDFGLGLPLDWETEAEVDDRASLRLGRGWVEPAT